MDRLDRQHRRTIRQRAYVARKREADPAWFADYLARNAAYRRNRAMVDADYRHERNMQAK